MYEESGTYSRPVKSFLNHYLANNQNRHPEDDLGGLFHEATRVIKEYIGDRAFRPVRPLNAAVLDSIMVGVMRRLDEHLIEDGAAMLRAYNGLIRNKDYLEATTSSTAAEDSVSTRLLRRPEAFADVY